MSEEVAPEAPSPDVRLAAQHNGRLGYAKGAGKNRPATAKAPLAQLPEDVMAAARSQFARLGGLKGGKVRSERLTPERKREIGRLGGLARWGKHL